MLDYKLYVANSTATPAIAQSPSSNYTWSITPVNLTNYNQGRYSQFTTEGTKVIVQPYYDYNDFPNNIFDDLDLFDMVTVWNGISSKVEVREIEPLYIEPGVFPVVYCSFNGRSISEYGILFPFDIVGATLTFSSTNNTGHGNYDENWDGSEIYLSDSYYDLTVESKRMVIAHELGHALKIEHVGYNFKLLSSDLDDINHNAILSIMNWGSPISNPTYYKATLYPSAVDKLVLRKKWGN